MMGVFDNNNLKIAQKGLDAAVKRQSVISNNIANINTPGYKRKEVKFEDALLNAMNSGNDVSSVSINATEDNTTLAERIDGNNVNMDREMSDMAQNAIRYEAVIRQVSRHFEGLKNVIRG